MTLPTTMRAVEITAPGGPDVLAICARPVPVPRAGEVLIHLSHAGVNRPDALQRAGLYAPPKSASDLPGLEGAGQVVAVGAGAGIAIGTPVCALLPGGGYAEYVVTPAAHCLPIPDGMDMARAACLPETFFTVFSNVVMRGGLTAGERFLVHGGASGIGTTAIQFARALGARVFATAGSAAKCAALLELGAEAAFDYTQTDFVAEMRARGGANLILDMVGGDYMPRNIKALANDGRLVNIAFLRGPKVELNFAEIMMRRLTLTGSTLRPQSIAAKAVIAARLKSEIWPLLSSGQIAPVMDSAYPLERAADAHRHLESNQTIGKIVLEINA